VSLQNTTNREFDKILREITNYVSEEKHFSEESLKIASYCLMDSIGCAIQALDYSACKKVLGPFYDNDCENGVRVPGTTFSLNPIEGAFNISTMIRWLDFNDTWLAKEWGHPSDNLGAILALTDWISQRERKIRAISILDNLIKAHEIQGVIALENSFNAVGLDHVILVKLASTAVGANILGLPMQQRLNSISHVFLDGNPLRTYRHFPNTGSRKSWAAGDASARSVFLNLLSSKGEMGYPTVLSAPNWGFIDALFKGKEFSLNQPFSSYVIDNILFKISYPAEFHAQTAIEAAIILHKKLRGDIKKIKKVTIRTHESAVRIIDKTGPLNNPADRDHCIQYMVAIGLLYGNLEAKHYEDAIAQDPRIDELRNKIVCIEDKQFSQDYLLPSKRSIANGVQIDLVGDVKIPEVIVEYPLGHKNRRNEGIPILIEKFRTNMKSLYTEKEIDLLVDFFSNIDNFQKYNSDFLFEILWKRDSGPNI